jgi:hypothetical protein
VRLVTALCNKYRPPLCKAADDDPSLAAKMLYLSKTINSLQTRVDEKSLDRRQLTWVKVDAFDVAPDFPRNNEMDIRKLTLGVYQLRMAKSYNYEHIHVDGKFKILVNDDIPNLLSSKIQNKLLSAKQYKC